MRHNIASELTEAMDSLYFSSHTKENMVKMLMKQQKQVQTKQTHARGKKLLLVALVAAAALVTLTGAAVFTRWSRSAQAAYNPSQQLKEQVEKSGLSVMLDGKTTETTPGEVLSVTDQGITVTAVQTVADNYGAELTFRIEGFTLPEDRDPWAFWDSLTIDGTREFYTAMGAGFFDGTTRNENGEWVYASNGQPVAHRQDEFQSVILDYVAEDGSLEYTIHISFRDNSGAFLGKEIAIHFNGFGIQSQQKAGESEKLVEGDWNLHWTLTGADSTANSLTITPNAEIGDSGLTLLEAEIGQKSIRAVYQSDHDWDGWKELEELSPGLAGVRLKNGDMIQIGGRSENYERWEQERICEVEYSTFGGLLDISQIEFLAYHKGWEQDQDGNLTIQTFDYIPIQ